MNQLTDIQVKKYIRIAIAVFVGIVIVVTAYLLFPKSYISFVIAPEKLDLAIDGGKPHGVTRGSTKLVIAGTHKYTFSRDGFTTETITLTTGNNETKELVFVPTAETAAAKAILSGEGTESQEIQERYRGIKEAAATAQLKKNYPILKDLPILTHTLSIRSCISKLYPKDPTKMALCVQSTTVDRAKAIAGPVLKNKGYDIANYEVIYVDPLENARTIGNPGEG